MKLIFYDNVLLSVIFEITVLIINVGSGWARKRGVWWIIKVWKEADPSHVPHREELAPNANHESLATHNLRYITS